MAGEAPQAENLGPDGWGGLSGHPGPPPAPLASDTTPWEGCILALPLPGCGKAGRLPGLSEYQGEAARAVPSPPPPWERPRPISRAC